MKTHTQSNKLSIEIGSPLLIQVSGNQKACKASIVGFKTAKYIIIEISNIDGVETQITDGTKITGVILSSGAVIRFDSHVIRHISKPLHLIIASFPDAIEQRNLRKSRRLMCSIPVVIKIINDMSEHHGVIINISTGGCRYYTKALTGGKAQSYIGAKFILVFELVGSIGTITLIGEVLGIELDREGAFLSIMFCDNEKDVTNKLSDYVSKIDKLLS